MYKHTWSYMYIYIYIYICENMWTSKMPPRPSYTDPASLGSCPGPVFPGHHPGLNPSIGCSSSPVIPPVWLNNNQYLNPPSRYNDMTIWYILGSMIYFCNLRLVVAGHGCHLTMYIHLPLCTPKQFGGFLTHRGTPSHHPFEWDFSL